MNISNHKIDDIVKNGNLKVSLMGILLMTAATFSLMMGNTNGDAFAQGSNNPFIGCAHTLLVTLSGLPNQTPDSSTHMALSQVGPNSDGGEANKHPCHR